VPSIERAARVREFQNKPSVRLALLSVTAAGVGLTLTAASNVVFAELHWTPGVLAQAEDRCHRIGQRNAVNITYCVCKDTDLCIDDSLWSMLGRKVGNLGRIIDGEKGKTMNALEMERTGLGLGASEHVAGARGVSVEEELTSFFAGSHRSATTHVTESLPVKGSIQSFFAKAAGLPKITKNVTLAVNTECIGEKAKNENSVVSVASSSSPLFHHAISPEERTNMMAYTPFTWDCRLCTFLNKSETILRPLRCTMCGSAHLSLSSEEEENVKKSEKNEITGKKNDDNDNNNDTSVSLVTLLDDEHNLHRRRHCMNKSSMQEIIEISDTENDAADDFISKDIGAKGIQIQEKYDVAAKLPPPVQHPSEDAVTYNVFKANETLMFSISGNSGRVAVHTSKGEPLMVNFEIEQIVTQSTSDLFLEMKIKRAKACDSLSQNCLTQSQINFNAEAMSKLITSIVENYPEQKNFKTELNDQILRNEVENFISAFAALREIEKKAIAEWGEPIAYSSLRKTLSNILVSSVKGSQTTERYGGGCMERALENSTAGTATEADEAVIRGEACAWCGYALSKASLRSGVKATYCSKECSEQGRIRRGGKFNRVRDQLFSLEGGICQKCGINAYALFLRINALKPVERLNALCNTNWNLPKSGQALDRLLQNPKKGDFWQADHIIAVAEGGGDCGLDNLQTLCTPCHRVETEKLRSRLRLNGGKSHIVSSSSPDIPCSSPSRPTNQLDIRSVFSVLKRKLELKTNISSTNSQKRNRKRSPD